MKADLSCPCLSCTGETYVPPLSFRIRDRIWPIALYADWMVRREILIAIIALILGGSIGAQLTR